MKPGILTDQDGFHRRMRANPYDSPRVLKAVLDEICERIATECIVYELSADFGAQLQHITDVLTSMVLWRGTPLRKLLAVECKPKPNIAEGVLFTLRPLSEDGRWLCEKMGLLEAPKVELPQATVKPKTEAPKLKVTRIVEI